MNHKRPNEFICQNVCEVEAFLGEVKYTHVRTTPDVNDLDNFKDFHFSPQHFTPEFVHVYFAYRGE